MTPPKTAERLLVCNCQRSMEIDGERLGKALGTGAPVRVHRELCRGEIEIFRDAAASGDNVRVACTQEAPLFREVAEEAGAGVTLTFTNIRERAGWCAAPGKALPKMAALLAEAGHVSKPAGALTLKSEGTCLVYGAGQTALDAAHELAGKLSVTLLVTDATDIMPPSRSEVVIAKGRIRRLSGHLGAFEVEVDGYAQMLPSSRATAEFAMARDGAKSKCDVVLDLSGGQPLLTEHARRDGYLHADPANPAALSQAMLAAGDLVGEFEKPLYVTYDARICAHARSGKVGCHNCLDHCPMGAIVPAGEKVAIDHAVCAGCGNCAAVCPTGAVSYALPGREDLIARAGILLSTYTAAGGTAPVILLHDEKHGDGLVSAMARHGRGLPVNVLPLAVNTVTSLGHEALAAMLAFGAGQVVLLGAPDRMAEMPALQAQVELVAHVLKALGHGEPRLHLVVEHDPDAVETMLWSLVPLAPAVAKPFVPRGAKREIGRMAFAALADTAPVRATTIALPKGSPYGRIVVDVARCTLCLSCVGACPASALSDNPERPQLSFTEGACVQCGVCVATCPEKVIGLESRLDLTAAANTAAVIKGEEPFCCIACGKPFAAKSSIERVVERLKGHAMFRNETQLSLIQMCDTCRVVKLAEQGGDPYRLGERPRIRTTDDYLAEAGAAKPDAKRDDKA